MSRTIINLDEHDMKKLNNHEDVTIHTRHTSHVGEKITIQHKKPPVVKEKTFGDIYDEFLTLGAIDSSRIEEYRPCDLPHHTPAIYGAIKVFLKGGGYIIYKPASLIKEG